MKTLIVGYGSMGREVEKILRRRGHEIVARVDPQDPQADKVELDESVARKADVAVEFSLAEAVPSNVDAYARWKLYAVVGTTGWEAARESVAARVRESGIGIVWGSNFSVGAHLFFSLVAAAAKAVRNLEDYDLLCSEIHHKRKKDSPSGTALTMANLVLENCPRKRTIVTERLDRPIRSHELHVASLRGGEVPGRHTLLLDSAADTVEITHNARSRAGFALGAVLAAEWIRERPGFFGVEAFIADLLT